MLIDGKVIWSPLLLPNSDRDEAGQKEIVQSQRRGDWSQFKFNLVLCFNQDRYDLLNLELIQLGQLSHEVNNPDYMEIRNVHSAETAHHSITVLQSGSIFPSIAMPSLILFPQQAFRSPVHRIKSRIDLRICEANAKSQLGKDHMQEGYADRWKDSCCYPTIWRGTAMQAVRRKLALWKRQAEIRLYHYIGMRTNRSRISNQPEASTDKKENASGDSQSQRSPGRHSCTFEMLLL